jgi:hypothetical protein
MRLADRLAKLEARSDSAADVQRQMEADAAAFVARIEAISARLTDDERTEAGSFRDHVLAGGDPFLIKAFGFVEYGDWQA